MTAFVCALLGFGLLLVPDVPASRLRVVAARHTTRSSAGRLRSRLPTDLVPSAAGGAAALMAVAAGLAVFAAAVGAGVWWSARRFRRTRARRGDPARDPLRMAVTGDLLAACLRAGMPVPTAVRAVAPTAQTDAAEALHATADLLALGAEPNDAWEPARRCEATAELATAARRTARSGGALAGVAEDMATRARAAVTDQVETRAQRAGVLVAGPLGLCFLPAFLCLGIAPVVLGLASRMAL